MTPSIASTRRRLTSAALSSRRRACVLRPVEFGGKPGAFARQASHVRPPRHPEPPGVPGHRRRFVQDAQLPFQAATWPDRRRRVRLHLLPRPSRAPSARRILKVRALANPNTAPTCNRLCRRIPAASTAVAALSQGPSCRTYTRTRLTPRADLICVSTAQKTRNSPWRAARMSDLYVRPWDTQLHDRSSQTRCDGKRHPRPIHGCR